MQDHLDITDCHPSISSATLKALEEVEWVEPNESAPEDIDAEPKVRTILVVDDEETVLQTLGRIVTREGYELVVARNGLEALNLLWSRDDIDLMFLDVMMPRLDGLRTVARIRGRDGSDLPVVMVSGRGHDGQILDGYDAGADYYVTKPFRPHTIRNIMHYLLGDLSEEEFAAVEANL